MSTCQTGRHLHISDLPTSGRMDHGCNSNVISLSYRNHPNHRSKRAARHCLMSEEATRRALLSCQRDCRKDEKEGHGILFSILFFLCEADGRPSTCTAPRK